MNEYSVSIILSDLTIVAESQERAEEIAMEIYYSDAYTKLHHGLSVECIETECFGTSKEAEETEV